MRLAAKPIENPDPGAPDAQPVRAEEFAKWMSRFAPFESAPSLAVAVSGGRDSMALAYLAADWARARGGEVLAVTVDHGLRENAAAEATQVRAWMAARTIPHTVLKWDASRPGSGLEEAARAARYALLEAFCRAHGVLHLLLGHHQSDQHETHVMRRARKSGPAGLAGMAGVRELTHLRVLRPLLEVPRARLTATLQERGLGWIEDPSNRDLRFERARLRAIAESAKSGLEEPNQVSLYGLQRSKSDHERAALAAASVHVNPAGFALLTGDRLRRGDFDVARDLLGRLISCVSGRVYPPRGPRLSSLWQLIQDDKLNRTRTLGGCLIRPLSDGKVLICREISALSEPQPVLSSSAREQSLRWDGRFQIRIARHKAAVCVDALGRAGLNNPQGAGHGDYAGLHRDVRFALPALYQAGELVARPSFDPDNVLARTLKVRFAPQLPVAGAVFGKV